VEVGDHDLRIFAVDGRQAIHQPQVHAYVLTARRWIVAPRVEPAGDPAAGRRGRLEVPVVAGELDRVAAPFHHVCGRVCGERTRRRGRVDDVEPLSIPRRVPRLNDELRVVAGRISPAAEFEVDLAIVVLRGIGIPGKQAQNDVLVEIDSAGHAEDVGSVPHRLIENDFAAVPSIASLAHLEMEMSEIVDPDVLVAGREVVRARTHSIADLHRPAVSGKVELPAVGNEPEVVDVHHPVSLIQVLEEKGVDVIEALLVEVANIHTDRGPLPGARRSRNSFDPVEDVVPDSDLARSRETGPGAKVEIDLDIVVTGQIEAGAGPAVSDLYLAIGFVRPFPLEHARAFGGCDGGGVLRPYTRRSRIDETRDAQISRFICFVAGERIARCPNTARHGNDEGR